MNMNLPGPSVMHEYLLAMGEEWVKNTYSITGDKIDEILYGGKLPTEEQQKKKVEKAFREDKERDKYMNKLYKDDKFIWDTPTKKQLKLLEIEEESLNIDEYVLKEATERYLSRMDRDMKYHGNVMKTHGWVMGERKIDKIKSITTDDKISDIFLKSVERGEVI